MDEPVKRGSNSRSKNDEIIKEVRENIQASYDADRDNREEAAQDLAFLAGDQWPESVRRERDQEGRPMLTINRLPQFVRQITNDIRQADIAIKVIPEDDNTDPALAEIYDGLIRQIQYRSSAKHIYATSAEHQASCGIGWFRVVTDYADDTAFEQEIKIKGVRHPLSVYCDPAAIEPDRSDAMWIAVTEMVPKATFKARYPKAAEVGVDAPSDGGATSFFWATSDDVRVCEYWRKVPVTKTLGLTQDGQTIDVTGMAPEMLAMMGVVRTRPCKTHKVVQYLVSGSEVLEGPHDWAGKFIPIIPVIGGETPLEERVYRYSAIRFARDPQRLYNFERTAMAEAVALAPKAPYLVTLKMIAPFKALWDTAYKKARPYLPYAPDPDAPGAKPYREQPPAVQTALYQQAQLASEDMKATTGIYDAALGAQSNETSGVAIGRRQIEADTANYHFADNLQRSLEYCGRILIDLIPKVYDSERVVRLMGEQPGQEKMVTINQAVMGVDGMPVLINDLSAASFDVRVTVGRSFQTRRQESAESMAAFMQAAPQAAPLIMDLYAKAMDWPDAEEVAKRLRAMIPPQALQDPDAPPPPPDPLQIEAEKSAAVEQIGKAQKATADARKSAAEADEKELQNRITLGQVMGIIPPPAPAEPPAYGP